MKEYNILDTIVNQQTAKAIARLFRGDGSDLFMEALKMSIEVKKANACKLRPDKRQSWEEYEQTKVIEAAQAGAYDNIVALKEYLDEEIKEPH